MEKWRSSGVTLELASRRSTKSPYKWKKDGPVLVKSPNGFREKAIIIGPKLIKGAVRILVRIVGSERIEERKPSKVLPWPR